ncbi:GNAT family N-acetyltransferase [Actinotalea sp.]|uniref:GNAT family N-acetyltransferase n=1 Tax=Actinotalea sp. TaxID=1872145 RepID=UPI003562D89A
MGLRRGDGRTSAVVGEIDLAEAAAVCAADPVASVLAAQRIEAARDTGARRGGPALWGARRAGELVGICWAGANLVPVCAEQDDEALDVLAGIALRQGRRCSSIVGPAGLVMGMWLRLEHAWGPAREVRAEQPSMVIDHAPAVPADPAVRLGRVEDLPLLIPACVAMFTEEVGYSPVEGGGGSYESRVRSLVASGRSFVRIDEGPAGPEVVFKAELGAVTRQVAQVQGVWVPPARRGQGVASAGMAAVVQATLRDTAPVVSLYVNSFNTPALGAYRRAGFREVGEYATVLF